MILILFIYYVVIAAVTFLNVATDKIVYPTCTMAMVKTGTAWIYNSLLSNVLAPE